MIPGTWDAGTTLTYQWKRVGSEAILGTDSNYLVAAADFGFEITVSVTGSKQFYSSKTRNSQASTLVARNPFTIAPKPTISGVLKIGSTLTAITTGWTPTPALITYQWLRNGGIIAGATASTYKLIAGDNLKNISVRVTATKPNFDAAVRMSDETAQIAPADFKSSSIPVIVGQATVGQTLTSTVSSWSPGATISYQWLADGEEIIDSVANAIPITRLLLGKKISLRITGSANGYASLTLESKETTNVVFPNIPLTSVPLIVKTGTTVSVGSTLSVNTGNWTTGVQFSYQWYRNGQPLGAATSSSYELTNSDLGAKMSISVEGRHNDYESITKLSLPTAAVTQGIFGSAPVPTLAGNLIAGTVLTANEGTWSPSPDYFTYVWKRSGLVIPGASSKTYALTSADIGKVVSVTVTGVRSGFKSISKVSVNTAKVAKLVAVKTKTQLVKLN